MTLVGVRPILLEVDAALQIDRIVQLAAHIVVARVHRHRICLELADSQCLRMWSTPASCIHWCNDAERHCRGSSAT